jgi:hypothetical protein
MAVTADRETAPPRNVVVVGSGRSGTSLVAGLVATAGHHMGGHLLKANDFNPRGFFEDYRTLLLNEKLLAPHTTEPAAARFTAAPVLARPLGQMQRWLAALPLEVEVRAPAGLEPKLRSTINGTPWCRKDPRFCHTLPAWEPVFGDALRVCVFREPSKTANSMVSLAHRQGVELTFDGAVEVWAAAYLRILSRHRHHGEWLFIHYDQLFGSSVIDRLEQAVVARFDRSVVDAGLRRSAATGQWPEAVDEIYRELCDAAGFELD